MGIGTIAKTGLQAALTHMESISNNIANVNTIGFKKSFVNFSDIYMRSADGASNQAIGLGTRVKSVDQNFSLGRIEASTRGLDLTLNGSGFFVQKNPGTGLVSYTRAGRMDIDKDGYLMGGGGVIQGYPVVNGQVIGSGALVDLQIPSSAIPAQATSAVTMNVNLDSSQQPITVPFDLSNKETYNFQSGETIYDSLGNSYLMNLYYTKTADNTWTTQAVVGGNIIGTGNMSFNSDGTLSSSTGLTGLSWNPGNGASAAILDINSPSTTQYAGQNSVTHHEQNGCSSGIPRGCDIDTNGYMNVSYSNGLTRVQGQIAVAQFSAPQGLARSDNMSWTPTTNSGTPILDSKSSQGAIIGNSIEYSNVDLTEELVSLISAQHDFQANAQVQQTYNQILQTIENI